MTKLPKNSRPGAASSPKFDSFAIGFDPRDRPQVHRLWDEVFDSGRWSEGAITERFEAAWAAWNELPAVAFSSWTGGALAALNYAQVKGEVVLCPSNTFMATPLAVVAAGGSVEFFDCNRHDLCASYDDFVVKAERFKPRAAWVVHIGGHIAFDIARIGDYCRDHGIFLIEDCAHAHGASWNGRRPGSWGDAGIYSLYATKTVTSGEGGIMVSNDADLLDFSRSYRNYGKFEHVVDGLNFRMSEFTAALALVQTARMPEIVAWKNQVARTHLDPLHESRVQLPDGMISGYYKYIVFSPIEQSTGKVYDQPCHRIMGHAVDLPNSDWVAGNHWCAPLYYHGGDALGGERAEREQATSGPAA